MTKRFFAWVLVVAMLLSLMPAITLGVSAEGEDKHTGHEGWTAWSDKTKLPATAGKYYLTVDVALTAQWTVPTGETHLCLGGHHITQTGNSKVIGVNAGRTLSVYDCAPAYEGETYVGGTISGGTGSDHGHGIWVARGNAGGKPGVFNLYGGRITGNKYTGSANAKGGAVYLQSGKKDQIGGVFNMYGGELYDNQASLGGAVYLHGESSANRGQTPATFTMYGGKIWKNTASKYTASGTTDGGHGSAIYGMHDAVIDIRGGEILENNAESTGTIYLRDDMVLTVSKATIRGNQTVNASAIYGQQNAKITIKDSVITENVSTATSAEGYGAAVYVTGTKSKVTLGGALTITGNTCKAAGIADLYLNSSTGADIETVYVDGITAGQVKFGVHDTAVTGVSDVVAFADPAKTGYASGSLCYIKENETKYVGLENGAFVFTDGHFHGSTFYAAWNDSTKLPSSGTYYLNTDVTLANYDAKAKVTGGKDLNLCLNGHTIDNKKNIVVQESFRVENAKLHLTDCTTRYDENGHFVSGGKITGGMKKGNGAVIYANNASAQIVVEGIAFVGNESTETNVAYGGGVVQLRKNTTPAQFIGCLFSENVSAGGGGAIALREGGNAGFEKCLFTKNSAAQAGAIYVNASTLALKDCKFTENTTTGAASVMNILGVSTVTIQDTTVTGNTGGAAEYGTVNLGGGNSKVKLLGKVIITDNTVKGGVQQNLHLQQYDNVQYDVSGLNAGSRIGITLLGSRISAGLMHFTTEGMTENPGYILSDDPNYKVVLDDKGRLALEEIVVIKHSHKLCNDDACSSHGDALSYQAWNTADSLPTSGNYFLETDVELTAATTISGTLNLCLNGHTITQTKTARVFYLNQDAKLNITDCADTGKIAGGKDDTGAAFYLNEGAVFSLYAGTITGSRPASNAKASSGAAIFLRSAAKGGATFNMYGGEITDNGNEYSWGGAITNGSGNAKNTVYVNIHGGKIYGNTAATGGAIRLERKAVLTITGGQIYENTATTGGAVYLSSGSPELQLKGGRITENTAATTGGIYVTSGAKLTLEGDPVVYDNTAAGKQDNLYLAGNDKLTLGDVKSAAKLGIGAATVNRAISTEAAADYSGSFLPDNSKMTTVHRENVLWLEKLEITEHYHKGCTDVKHDGCEHDAAQKWIKWGDDEEEQDSLPTASGYYYLTRDIQLTGAATINKQDVSLCLNGHTVTAAEKDRHYLLETGATLTITDCSKAVGGFTGGDLDYGGSVNMAPGSTLNLYAGKFYGNNSNMGGAIYMRGGTDTVPGAVLNMYGGQISGNTAKDGAGLRVIGTGTGADPNGVTPSQVAIYDGTISDNHATNNGAGINISGGADLAIRGGQLRKNKCDTNGGAILATGQGTTITMNGGTISGNTARNGGGLITQSDSAFILNGGTITGNKVTHGGGGVYISTNTSFRMNGGTIGGNTANNGGGIYALRSRVMLDGGTISSNKAATSAGAFRAEGATVVLNKITIDRNSSKDGGTAYIMRATVTSGDQKQYVPSKVTVNEGALITGNKGEANSGGFLIANEGVVVTVNGGEFSKNTAANGGALMTWSGSTLILNGGKISGNSVKGNGGGIYVSSKSTFKMNGGSITGNTAKNGGGAYLLRANADLLGGTIASNTARVEITWKDGKEVKDGGNAGGIYISGAKVNLRGTSVAGNSADVNGGAIVMGFASHKENGVTIRSNVLVNIYGGTISGNIAKNAAGGMLIQSEGTVVNMYGGTFTNNTGKNAGAIYVSTKTQFNMTGGTIANNTATASAGAFYVLNSTATITGGQFYGNTAATSGGLLVTSGDITVVRMENVKVHDNKAKTHGAVFIQGKATFFADNCDFYHNDAGNGGNGGVCIGTQCKGQLKNCKFYGNSSEATSGAMMISTMAEVSIENCDFTENYAATMGGVMYTNPASQVTIKNSTFSKNTAGTRGGAITCKGNMFLIDCTLENNSAAADGGAVYTDINAANGSGEMRGLVVENSQIRNNTSGGKGGGFYVYMGCRLELHNSQVTGNTAVLEGGAVWSFEDLELHNTKITGNSSGGEGYAVYMNDANYDGHSYFANANKLSGNVIVKDNQGGDLYMGPDVFFAITAEGLGEDTHMEVTLDSGVLTQRILGAYHYEGGNRVYTVTYGTTSMTDPECDTTLAGDWDEQTQQQKTNNDIWLYVGIGAFVLVIAAVAAVLLIKKKKPEKAGKE